MSQIRTFLLLSSLLGTFLLAGCDGESLEAPFDQRTSAPGPDERVSEPGYDEPVSEPGSDKPVSTSGSALLSWHPPRQRTDGSPLRGLAGYRVYFGKSPNPARYILEITNPGQTSQFIDNLDQGTWYFSISAYDRKGRESAKSTPASKTIG